ncbi:MAG TPA: IclR family transcriptional regulator [Anaerolineaceae bacterium]|nr:IclR family transcriptional regulator [Anaerolineaceae bacterium]
MKKERIQTIDRVIQIMDCFSIDQNELGVREVARLTGLSSSVCGRLMMALRDQGLLLQNPESRAYSVGPKSLRWAEVYTTNLDIRNVSLPVIHELLLETKETISLYILEGDERLCVERMESAQNVRIVARIGRRLPLYAGSAGKLLLAFLPETRQEEILATAQLVPFTNKTITDIDKLKAELIRIRKQGYAFSDGEWVEDAAGIASPIFDMKGDILAALTISGPSFRFTPEKISFHREKVLLSSERISIDLGYIGSLYSNFRHSN